MFVVVVSGTLVVVVDFVVAVVEGEDVVVVAVVVEGEDVIVVAVVVEGEDVVVVGVVVVLVVV
jgi:hypothetical protein